MRELNTFLKGLSVRQPIINRNLAIYPILGEHGDLPTIISLDEAIERSLLQVKEVSESGNVPDLLIANRSDGYILIIEGEEVVGGKQNRVFNMTILVSPHSEIKANVACCEAGRWGYRKHNFDSGKNLLASRIRTMSKAAVTRNVRDHNMYSTDQHGVWNGIEGISAAYGARSETSAYHEIKENVRARLDDYMQGLEPVENQVGAFFEVNGEPLGLEIICQGALWGKNFSKIAESFATEALLHPQREQNDDIMRVNAALEQFGRFPTTVHQSVGEGLDVRFESPGFIGSGLLWMETFLHLSILFHSEDQEKSRNYHLRPFRDRVSRRRQGQSSSEGKQ